MYRALDLTGSQDPFSFSAFLWNNGIVHQIITAKSDQTASLWVEQARMVPVVRHYYHLWQSASLPDVIAPEHLPDVIAPEHLPGETVLRSPLSDWKKMPVTLLLTVASLLVAIITDMGQHWPTTSLFTLSDFKVTGRYVHYTNLAYLVQSWEIWRLVTPILLHFSYIHLIFNLLCFLDFGHRLETAHGSWVMVATVLLTAVCSNLIQYQVADGFLLFGGMSGVIYALLGFFWIRERTGAGLYRIEPGLYLFMGIWLCIGFTALPQWLGLGKIANGAHVGGLVAGLALGALYSVCQRWRTAKEGTARL